jgi:hypothetical protein
MENKESELKEWERILYSETTAIMGKEQSNETPFDRMELG